jgi:hypothetical protein
MLSPPPPCPALQAEMNDILRDAAAKLSAAKDAGGKGTGGGRAGSDPALRSAYDREKAAAASEFEAFKKRAAARERDLQSEHNERLTGLKVPRCDVAL